MKTVLLCLVIIYTLNTSSVFGQTTQVNLVKSDTANQFKSGVKQVNKCTPWHHLKCVYITGREVVEDGLKGKATRHWWRKSYIGQACTDKYGKTFGNIFEGMFAVPHYLSIAVVNGLTLVASIFRASPEKVVARQLKREKRRTYRKERRRKRELLKLK